MATPSRLDDRAAFSGLRSKIEWLLLFRVLLATLLLGSAIIVNVNNVASFTDGRYLALSAIIVATYVVSAAFGLFLRWVTNLVLLVHAQILLDVLLIAGVVVVTGGVESLFIFLFFLAIFSGANLLQQKGALSAATMATIVFLMIGLVQFSSEPVASLTWLQQEATDVRLPIYNATVHVFAFYIVAFLSGFLAEKLGSTDEALRQREQDVASLVRLNELIVRNVRAGMLTVDANGRITLANRAAGDILARPVSALVGSRLTEVLPELEFIADASRGTTEDVRLRRAGGEPRLLSTYAVPLDAAGEEPAGALVVFQDVTELRELEEQVRRQAQLAAVGQLSASIAHEIRNPLASIAGAAELLRTREAASPRDERLQGIVLREVDRLNRLVEDFLSYARPRHPELRECDAALLVEEVVESMRAGQVGGVTLGVRDRRPPDARTMVPMDSDMIRQVLWNLLRNAVEASPMGGVVEVILQEEQDERGIRVLELRVEDEGDGLGEEALRRLFEPFFTSREKGTGLGLATSARFVEAHGGRILAFNRPEGGACFRVLLPGRMGERLDSAGWPTVAPGAGRKVENGAGSMATEEP